METTAQSFFEKLNTWIRESVTIKLGSIGFLTLILLIPQAWIGSLISERASRAQQVSDEISSSWGGSQVVGGPILVIPYLRHETINKDKGVFETRNIKENAFFLPESLSLNGKIDPQQLHRGIFEAVVYDSYLDLNAGFAIPDFARLAIAPEDVLWKESYLVVTINHLTGISDDPTLTMGGKQLTAEPSSNVGVQTGINPTNGNPEQSGLVSKLQWSSAADFAPSAIMHLNLKGSSSLLFIPAGKTTNVSLTSSWPDPGFTGQFLPSSRTVKDKGFTATWKILHYNRPFAQQWTQNNQSLGGSDFGVSLVIPNDQYQQTTRTAKYGVLVILLTFVALFMVEIIQKIRIHPVQYILVGSALSIYYLLLLSLSEQTGYALAYLIATVATIGLISAYFSGFIQDRRTILLLSSWMTLFYGFIFVIIQEQDYSLLMGSAGLFLILSAIMYFSRRVKWYK